MSQNKKVSEFDVIGLLQKMLKAKKKLAICLGVGTVVGLIVALNTPKVYQSSVVLAPEVSGGSLSQLGGLSDVASSFGIDIGGKSSIDAIYPEIYPTVVASSDFLMSLFNTQVRLKGDNSLRTYKDHLSKDLKLPFWNYPGMWLSDWLESMTKGDDGAAGGGRGKPDPMRISKSDMDIVMSMQGSILCTVDKKTSLITINVVDQDPMVAAIMADTIQSRLQAYITRYRTKKARNDMEYYKKLMTNAKRAYEKERRAYGSYADANTDVVLESYKSKAEDMENDMQLKYNSYTTLNTQYQLAAAKVQERTPAFTIIQTPHMSYKSYGTPRKMILFGFMLLGIVVEALWVFIGDWRAKRRQR